MSDMMKPGSYGVNEVLCKLPAGTLVSLKGVEKEDCSEWAYISSRQTSRLISVQHVIFDEDENDWELFPTSHYYSSSTIVKWFVKPPFNLMSPASLKAGDFYITPPNLDLRRLESIKVVSSQTRGKSGFLLGGVNLNHKTRYAAPGKPDALILNIPLLDIEAPKLGLGAIAKRLRAAYSKL